MISYIIDLTKLTSWLPSKLSAAGAKLGVKSVPMRTVPSRRSTGRPGPSDDDDYDDDDDGDDDDYGYDYDHDFDYDYDYDYDVTIAMITTIFMISI